jgi:hypothetical protein
LTPSDFILAEQQVTDQRAKDQGKNQGVRESRISKEESTKKQQHKERGHCTHLLKMGKLIKNHWARLIIMTAAVYQIAAAVEGYFWPKIFWDFLTRTLDPAVRPIPVLQTINLVFGLWMLALEWPLGFIAGSPLHRSLEFRLAILPLTALSAALMYQATNPAIYYMIGMVVYFWAYSEGEIICAKPWTLPQRGRSGGSKA